MNRNKLWKDARVRWSFVSNHDNKFAKFKDDEIGLSDANLQTVLKAMKQIEEDTCIEFVMDNSNVEPEEWLLIFRETKAGDESCQKKHITALAQKNPEYKRWFGTVADAYVNDPDCPINTNYAYAYYGAGKPQHMVIALPLTPGEQYDVGFMIHELLHNLGLGHTQKREDRDDFIDIVWKDIESGAKSQYQMCTKASSGKDACTGYKTFGLPYDCESIMHYEGHEFLTEDARNADRKTMYAKTGSTCRNSSIHQRKERLSQQDIEIMNRMYCHNEIQKREVTSPNHPKSYPENSRKEEIITVTQGFHVELTFLVFNVEAGKNKKCVFDWVQIFDKNGTPLTPKLCGSEVPKPVTSETNGMKVKFSSDYSMNFDGFRARWKQVDLEEKQEPIDKCQLCSGEK